MSMAATIGFPDMERAVLCETVASVKRLAGRPRDAQPEVMFAYDIPVLHPRPERRAALAAGPDPARAPERQRRHRGPDGARGPVQLAAAAPLRAPVPCRCPTTPHAPRRLNTCGAPRPPRT